MFGNDVLKAFCSISFSISEGEQYVTLRFFSSDLYWNHSQSTVLRPSKSFEYRLIAPARETSASTSFWRKNENNSSTFEYRLWFFCLGLAERNQSSLGKRIFWILHSCDTLDTFVICSSSGVLNCSFHKKTLKLQTVFSPLRQTLWTCFRLVAIQQTKWVKKTDPKLAFLNWRWWSC